jgi:hypothetical protein
MARRGPWRTDLVDSRGLSSSGLRLMGMMLILVGLVVASMAFVPEDVEGQGAVVIFPFVLGNIGVGAASVFSLMFFALFILSSLLPWYMIQRRSSLGNRLATVHTEERPRCRGLDTMDYIITAELPVRLRRSIYIEADEEAIHLRSTEDEAFLRSYSLPSGFEVDNIDYSYEGSFLLLKLMLKRYI